MGNIFAKRQLMCCSKEAKYKCTMRDTVFNLDTSDDNKRMEYEFNHIFRFADELKQITGYKYWSMNGNIFTCTCCEECALMIEKRLDSEEIMKRWEYDFEYSEQGYYVVDLP